MIAKRAMHTVIFTVSLCIIILLIAFLSGGPYFKKVVPMSTAILFSGLTIFISSLPKGKKMDQECDERETYISNKAMRFAFYTTCVSIFAFWSYEVAQSGVFMNTTTYILYALLGSYLLSYGYYKLKH